MYLFSVVFIYSLSDHFSFIVSWKRFFDSDLYKWKVCLKWIIAWLARHFFFELKFSLLFGYNASDNFIFLSIVLVFLSLKIYLPLLFSFYFKFPSDCDHFMSSHYSLCCLFIIERVSTVVYYDKQFSWLVLSSVHEKNHAWKKTN